jgi:RHS repeat-associated protein
MKNIYTFVLIFTLLFVLKNININAQSIDLFTQTEYENTYLQVRKVKEIDSKSVLISPVVNGSTYDRFVETTFTYPFDYTDAVSLGMLTQNRISTVITKTVEIVIYSHSDNSEVSRTPISYEKNTYKLSGTAYLLEKIETKIGNGTLQTLINFEAYDSRANLTKYKLRNGQTTSLEWFPITDIGKIDLLKTHTVGGGNDGTILSRSMNYDYKPLIGLISTKDINDYESTYAYDDFNRLKSLSDPQNYLLKDFRYHYAAQTALTDLGLSPTNSMNYVVSRTAREAQTGTALSVAVNNTTTQIQYMDGLGRALQSQIWQGSPDKTKDIITATRLYDSFGRGYKGILPTPSDAQAGEYKSTAQTLGSAFYVDTCAFSKTVFESSPLNRPLKQFGAGQAWRTVGSEKFVAMEYRIAGNEVWQFNLQTDGSVKGEIKYPDNSLFNNLTISERDFWTIELKDKLGRVVNNFQQLENGNVFAITAYVYDDLGRLAYVIPPEIYKQFGTGTGQIVSFTEGDAIFKEGIYGYHFDNLGRQIEKHIPGAGWIRYVYDKNDRIVMESDEKDNESDFWKFTKYDALSRPIMTGTVYETGTKTRQTIQSAFDGHTEATYEVIGTTLLGYTNTSFPDDYKPEEIDVKTVIYYDNYDWQTNNDYNFQTSTAFHDLGLTKGLMTGTLIRNLETNAWYKFVNYYDYKGRNIQTFAQNHLGGIDRTDYQYRFNNEVLILRMEHQGINEIYNYDYDHLGRKTAFKHTLNGTLKNVAKYEYDQIGRLKTKKLSPTNDIGTQASGEWNNTNVWLNGSVPSVNDHVFINETHTITIPNGQAGSAGSLFLGGVLNNYGRLDLGKLPSTSGESNLQAIDYSYHIRGGLRGINLDGSGNLTNKLFSLKLGYEDSGFYDGNIGKQEWKSSIDNVSRSFTYSYDGLSRIIQGLYTGTGSENYSLNSVSYDKNGNITNLSRNGLKSNNTFGLVDNLNYTYQANSNKIQEVTDNSIETASFADATGTTDYSYSLDGSLTSDANKGISIIEYNYLKKPRRIVKSGVEILYQYDASGKKLKETIGSNVTDYLGNLIYKNNSLYQISHDEGRIIDGEYEYNISDHLGNLRVAFRDSLGIAKITQANSYGIWGENLTTLNFLKLSWKQDRYKFTGKEELPETGYTDFGARFYDNLVPRFLSIDPLAELSREFNPFTYADNNPVLMIDPDGMASTYNWQNGKYEDNGNEVSWKSVQQEYGIGQDDKGKAKGVSTGRGGGDNGTPYSPPEFLQASSQQNASISQTPSDNFTSDEKAAQLGVNIAGAIEGGYGFTKGLSWLKNGLSGLKSLFTSTKILRSIWNDIKATQSSYPGSVLPKSFELATENGTTVWVHANGTKHIAEFLQMKAINATPETVRLITQIQLQSLQGAVNLATKNGVPFNQLLTIGGWELKFAAPRIVGQLPALIHALPK